LKPAVDQLTLISLQLLPFERVGEGAVELTLSQTKHSLSITTNPSQPTTLVSVFLLKPDGLDSSYYYVNQELKPKSWYLLF